MAGINVRLHLLYVHRRRSNGTVVGIQLDNDETKFSNEWRSACRTVLSWMLSRHSPVYHGAGKRHDLVDGRGKIVQKSLLWFPWMYPQWNATWGNECPRQWVGVRKGTNQSAYFRPHFELRSSLSTLVWRDRQIGKWPLWEWRSSTRIFWIAVSIPLSLMHVQRFCWRTGLYLSLFKQVFPWIYFLCYYKYRKLISLKTKYVILSYTYFRTLYLDISLHVIWIKPTTRIKHHTGLLFHSPVNFIHLTGFLPEITE